MIYDCIEFFNEIDLLELRLNELWPIVDKFVISESTKTHTGKDKELYFMDNFGRFSPYRTKIIYQIVTNTPENYVDLDPNKYQGKWKEVAERVKSQYFFWPHENVPYGRDAWEKESLFIPLRSCEPWDIIMYSDVDEIPRASVVKEISESFDYQLGVYNLQQDMYMFYMNTLKDETWFGTTMISYKKLQDNNFCHLRKFRQGRNVSNAGWHFTSIGGPDKVVQKIESYGEQSVNTEYNKWNMSRVIESCIEEGHDLLNRPCHFEIKELDDSYPRFVLENPEIYGKYFYET